MNARRRLLPLLALVCLIAAAALPASASALPRWHKHTLTYRDTSQYTWQVLAVIKWINDSPVNLRIKPAKHGKIADITFKDVNKHTKWDGQAAGSYSHGRYRVIISLNHYYFDKPTFYPLDWMKAEVITHEVGHALGLNHRKGCSVMLAKGLPGDSCRAVEGDPVNVRCGPFRGDIQALIRLYGGKISTYDAYRCAPVGAPPPA